MSKISSEREKKSILKYDYQKFSEKIDELNTIFNEIDNELKSIKDKENLLLKGEDSKGKVKKK